MIFVTVPDDHSRGHFPGTCLLHYAGPSGYHFALNSVHGLVKTGKEFETAWLETDIDCSIL